MAIITAICLLILVTALFIVRAREWPREHALPAVVWRDCAPWDGGAFTIAIPVEKGTIHISVWKSPNIKLPVIFSFPDETGTIGSAFLLPSLGASEELNGRVLLQGVSAENPVQGRFDLVSETGGEQIGTFIAAWDHEIVFCG